MGIGKNCCLHNPLAIGDDIIAPAAGPLKTRAGHSAGSEAAIHAMKDMFDDSD